MECGARRDESRRTAPTADGISAALQARACAPSRRQTGCDRRSRRLQDLAARICAALPGAFGTIIVQVFVDGQPDDAATDLAVIEINARYGGGFPLALEAGADFPRWQLEELLGLPSTAAADAWRDGLVMLRYDAAVFVDEADAPT